MVIKVQTDSKGIVDTLLKVGDLGRFINEEGYRKLPNHIIDEVARLLDNFEMYRAGASGEAGQRNQIAMVFNNANQGEYMMYHQEGDGVPQRRFFPDSDDLMSPNYADFRERVGELLSNYTAELVARRLRG